MYLPGSQRKLMVLHQRLREIACHHQRIVGGTLAWSNTAGSQLSLRHANGDEEELFPIREFNDYIAGRRPNTQTLARFDQLTLRLFPGDWPDSTPISNNEVIDTFAFAKRVGVSRARSRYIIDQQYAANLPMFSSLARGNAAADKFCTDFSGCYRLYRRDINPNVDRQRFPMGMLVRSAMCIRYPVPYKRFTSKRKGQSRIRCKLNMPSYAGSDPAIYKFDGVVARTGTTWTWLLQGRLDSPQPSNEDLLLMYTSAFRSRDTDRAPIVSGTMLTQNRDNAMTPTVSTVVLMREPGYQLKQRSGRGEPYYAMQPDERAFMHSTPGLVDLTNQRDWSKSDRMAVDALERAAHDVNRAGLVV